MWKGDWSGSEMAEPSKKKRPRGVRPIRRNMDDPKPAKSVRPIAEPEVVLITSPEKSEYVDDMELSDDIFKSLINEVEVDAQL
jgi:hypothetical protein